LPNATRKLVALRPGGGHIVISRRGLSAQKRCRGVVGIGLGGLPAVPPRDIGLGAPSEPLWDATLEDIREREPIAFETMLGRLRFVA